MPNRFQRGGAKAGQSATPFMVPGVALAMWNPFLTGTLDGNIFGELGTIANEWQDFVSRRIKEDVALLQRLSRSTALDQILDAYAEFWRKAGEDYGSEITTMTKLMTDTTSKMAVAAQSATEEATRRLSEREAA